MDVGVRDLSEYLERAARRSGYLMRYVDSSALLKRYTGIEVRRNLARLLSGRSLETAKTVVEADWERTLVVALDDTTCELALKLRKQPAHERSTRSTSQRLRASVASV